MSSEVPPQSSFAFTQPKYLVLESGGDAVIGVTRTAVSGGNLDLRDLKRILRINDDSVE